MGRAAVLRENREGRLREALAAAARDRDQLRAIVLDWEETIRAHEGANDEDLRFWLDNVADRLQGKREEAGL